MSNPTALYVDAPSVEDVVAYLGPDVSWSSEETAQALDAEATDQANRCRFPVINAGPDIGKLAFTPALSEALCRRVAHNLALRRLPLGLEVGVTDGAISTTFVGGTDGEVRRLEAPYRRVVVG